MTYNIQEIQKLENELLREVVRVCDENDITYYGAYGTVLGAVRHNGMIPWDGDVDIYVPENELDSFVEAMKTKLDSKYWLDYGNDDHLYRDFPRVGFKGYGTGVLHVDVFILSGTPAQANLRKIFIKKAGIIHKINDVKQKGLKNYFRKRYKMFRAFCAYLGTSFVPVKYSVKLANDYCRRYSFQESEYVGYVLGGVSNEIFPKRLLGNGKMIKYDDFEIRIPEFYDEYLRILYGDYMKFPPEEEINKALNRVYYEIENPQTGMKTLYHRGS